MSDKEYIVEIVVCRYSDGSHWRADGRQIAIFKTLTEAKHLATHLTLVAKDEKKSDA